MLKISQVNQPGAMTTLKLEGKLLAPWVDELLQACESQVTLTSGIRLDLSALTFVDAAGAKLLRDLIQRGFAISACSGYVAELLHTEKP